MRPRTLSLLILGLLLLVALRTRAHASVDETTYQRVLAAAPQVGDVVFTRIGGPVFSRVADTSGSWTSHVGVIVDYRNGDWVVAESAVPFVKETPLRRFLGRSVNQEFSIRRLVSGTTPAEQAAMRAYADAHLHKIYNLGFNLDSTNTYCSKFARDVIAAGTGQQIGRVETFEELLHENPKAPVGFWTAWFFGRIPWQRRTVTPASELTCPLLRPVIENHV